MRFRVTGVPADGNCLFHAIVRGWLHVVGPALAEPSAEAPDFEGKRAALAAALRELSARHLFSHACSDEPLTRILLGMDADLDAEEALSVNFNRRVLGRRATTLAQSGCEEGESVADYLERMRRDGEWAGEDSIVACADLLGCRIVCFSEGEAGITPGLRFAYGRRGWPRIRVLFHADASHYSSLLPVGEE